MAPANVRTVAARAVTVTLSNVWSFRVAVESGVDCCADTDKQVNNDKLAKYIILFIAFD